MPTRYQQLRQAVSILASSADEQVRFLDELFARATEGAGPAAYGNDELALVFDDLFCAAADMVEHGELSEAERLAVLPLDDLLRELSGEKNSEFWQRAALFADPRWTQVRVAASRSLAQLPDEERAIGRSA